MTTTMTTGAEREGDSASPSQLTAPNLTVTAASGTQYAYRRFGGSDDGVPLVFLIHFRGNLDSWDPALVDPIAARREVVLVDLAGVGGSTGETPRTVASMTAGLIEFLDALGIRELDLFGFSLGGFIAQEFALTRPWALRALVLAGTGPAGAPNMHGWREDIQRESRHDVSTPQSLLYIFFAHTESSQAKGVEFLRRFSARTDERDAPTSLSTRDAQYDAVLEWGTLDWSRVERLTQIAQPTLILQGDDDLMIRTPSSHLMAGLIPNARIHIFEDAAHASIFQYPQEAADLVLAHIEAATDGGDR